MQKTDSLEKAKKQVEISTRAYLVVASEFFNQIKDGSKKVEYRYFNDYYCQRLLSHPLKTVIFSNGYGGERITFEIDWIGVLDGDNEIRAFDDEGNMNEEGKSEDFIPDTISIHLGKRID